MIQANSPTPLSGVSLPELQLVTGPTTWFHCPLARTTHLAMTRQADPAGAAVQALLQWLLHQGALYTLEFRLCASGQHAGFWLGLTGHGATPKHAVAVAREGEAMLASFFRLNGWRASQRTVPRLPRWSAGLRFLPGHGRMDSVHALLPQRAFVAQMAERGAPLVMQVRMQARQATTSIYHRAAALENRLPGGPQHRSPRSQRNRFHTMIGNLMDDAVDLTATVCLSAARPPSPMRLRKLAHAFHGSRLIQPWAEEPTPTRATLAVLRDSLALMAGKEVA